MKLTKAQVQREKWLLHPFADTVGDTMTIYYRVKPNNKKRHIIMHSEDQRYMYLWLQRLIADICNKQMQLPELFRAMTKYDKHLPRDINGNMNSLLSYASGIVSNKFRNPSEDLTVKHLKYVEDLFHVIYNIYSNMSEDELGYDYRTGVRNELPYRLKFKQV